MVLVNDVLEYMWSIAPEAGKEPWDNVGLLVGRKNASVTKALVALDITFPVIAEAKAMGTELIVSHHPLIWDTYKHVTDTVLQQDKVMTLLENHLAAICMHTNLDEAIDGVDDTLCETLGLLPECHLAEGRIGHVSNLEEPVDLQDFLALVQEKLQANGLRYFDAGRSVRRVGTGCGSCGEYLREAHEAGCDTFITGDVKYSVFLDAQGYGMNLIDAGHFPTENPIVRKVAGKLREAFPQLEIRISESIAQPDQFFTGKNHGTA